jgi:hypothetical protein
MPVTKDHILREIRRTAEENGGVPLGRVRFFTATGIGNSDWLGKIWARWGDALREAGFKANEPQGAYDEDNLLEAYIRLARELGRFPVEAELRMQRRRDANFPSHSTFRKFGGRALS